MKRLLLITLLGLLYSISYSQSCATTSKLPYQWPSHRNWLMAPSNDWTGQIRNMSTGAITVVGNAGTGVAVTTYEGSSTVSDDKGNLLFYTNGRRIWTGSGAGTTLKYSGLLEGNEGGAGATGSAVQGIIVVRHPLDPTTYHVFTTDDVIGMGANLGFNYFKISTTGTLIAGPTRLGTYNTSEGVAATFHSNGVDIWITCYEAGTANYNSYLLKCTGLVTTPVVSSVATPFSGNELRGGLAFSYDGTHFAQAHSNATGGNSDKEVSVYDFNNTTGVISNARNISDVAANEAACDVNFSPDGSKIYYSTATGQIGFYDLSSWNTTTIKTTRQFIAGVSQGVYPSIEIGPDGNMYIAAGVAGTGLLGKVTGNLNAGGPFTFSTIAGTQSSLGLPNMFLPPQEEPDIQEVPAMKTCDAAVDLSTKWLCSGLDAESTVAPASVYTSSCGACINATSGLFNPTTAGVGHHQVIFTKCSVDDTIFIDVTSCAVTCLDTTLKNGGPICVGATLDLTTMLTGTSSPGTWSITTAPAGATPATITGTTFSAANTNTIAGSYVVRHTLSPAPADPSCPKYSERTIIVNAKPTLTFTTTDVCEGAATITFNGSPANGTYSGTGITGATFNPTTAGTTAVTYTYTDGNGCINSAAANQKVNPKPTVTFTTTDVCEGAANITFNGSPASGVYSGTGITGATFTPSAAGTTAVTYTYTDGNGCVNSATANQKVNPKPTVTFTTTDVCEGTSTITFNGSPTNGVYSGTGITGATFNPSTAGTTAVTYTYTDGNGCINSAAANQKVNPKPTVTFTTTDVCEGAANITFNGSPASGVYSGTGITGATFTPSAAGTTAVTYTYTDGNGCVNSATANQKVNPKPTVTFTTTDVCEGTSTITFNGSPTNGVYSGTGITGATFNPSTAGTTAVTYTYTDGNGCINSAAANQKVNPKPTVTFSTTDACAGDAAITFNGNPANGTYSGTGITGATFNPTTAGTTAVTYTYTDGNGCINSAAANQKVNPKPTVNLGLDKTICPGGTTSLDAGNAGATFAWTGPSNYTSSSNPITVSNGGSYTVVVTNSFSCTASDIINVNVNANLTINLGNDTAICQGQSMTFTANYSGTGVTYAWTGPNGYTNSINPVNVSDAGSYHVHVVDPMGCQGDDDVVLTVNALPTPSVTNGQVCQGQSYSFNAGNYTSYSWTGPNGFTSTSNPISVNTGGTYNVSVKDANNCSNTTSATLTINVNPTVNLGLDYTGCGGTSATFDAANTGSTYLWSDASTGQTISVTTDGVYSVIISSANNCKGYDTVQATFIPVPTLEIGADVNLCAGESKVITAVVNPSSSIVTWGNSSTNTLSYTASTGGMVYANANNGGICSAKDSLEVFIHDAPKVTGIKDTTVCFLSVHELTIDAGPSATQYNWSDGQSGQSITITKDGRYTVDLISTYGCKSTDAVTISEDCPSSIYAPTAFTPNNDGTNDKFYVKGENIYDFELFIFNRWGEVIFHSKDMNEGWNGKKYNDMHDAQVDVYVWKINYKYWSDWKNKGKIREEVGRVTLIK